MRFETASRTDVGRSGKGSNEDAVGLHIPTDAEVLERYGFLLAVADGVPSYRHMCTTLVTAAVFPDRVVFANIGDSRGYIVPSPAGAARQVTVEHSEVQEMVEQGLITPEEAEVASNRNIITRVVGTDPDVEVDVFDVPLTVGDTVLLCSDGLVTVVTDAEVADIVQHNPVEAAVDQLIELAKGRKGHDNVTVCAARLFL